MVRRRSEIEETRRRSNAIEYDGKIRARGATATSRMLRASQKPGSACESTRTYLLPRHGIRYALLMTMNRA